MLAFVCFLLLLEITPRYHETIYCTVCNVAGELKYEKLHEENDLPARRQRSRLQSE